MFDFDFSSHAANTNNSGSSSSNNNNQNFALNSKPQQPQGQIAANNKPNLTANGNNAANQNIYDFFK